MRKKRQSFTKLTTMFLALMLISSTMVFTACDDLEKALSQLDEIGKEEPEPKEESDSNLPPIGSVIVKNALDAYEGEEEEEATEDVMPQFDSPYVNEDGGVWTFMASEDGEGQFDATFADPTKKGKLSHYFLEKRGNSAYDVYPKNGDFPVSVSIIRIKEDGLAIEESRGSSKTIFVLSN